MARDAFFFSLLFLVSYVLFFPERPRHRMKYRGCAFWSLLLGFGERGTLGETTEEVLHLLSLGLAFADAKGAK